MSPRLSATPPAWRNVKLRQVGFLQGHAWEQFELPWYSRGSTLFWLLNTAPAISLLGSQPTVVTVHDLSYKYFPEAYRATFRLWYSFIIPLALRHARCVITVSESERQAIIRHYPAVVSRLHAIANGGLPADLTLDARGFVDRSDGYILYVGSLSKRKNFSRMLEAACLLARERGCHFIFIGDMSKSLKRSIARVPDDISSLITFVGAVDDPAMLISYYRRAVCFLFPSLYESSGLPPVEAMACGCPVIASDIPALKERCGEAVIYCNPYDIGSIVDSIEKMLDDDGLRARLRVLGSQRAATYSWQSCAIQTLDLIHRCAEKGSHSSHLD
jgi:glycosyltransferase involved in cell wall biosynthesis